MTSEQIIRIHVTGGPGAGKTRLSRRISAACSLPIHDLDALVLSSPGGAHPGDDIAAHLAESQRWVSDGVYFAWAQPFLDRAQLVIWLDVPWRVASYRLMARHVKLGISGDNQFPGWRRFHGFWRWAARYYSDRNEPKLDRPGVPGTRSTLLRELAPYRDKLVVCRTTAKSTP